MATNAPNDDARRRISSENNAAIPTTVHPIMIAVNIAALVSSIECSSEATARPAKDARADSGESMFPDIEYLGSYLGDHLFFFKKRHKFEIYYLLICKDTYRLYVTVFFFKKKIIFIQLILLIEYQCQNCD